MQSKIQQEEARVHWWHANHILKNSLTAVPRKKMDFPIYISIFQPHLECMCILQGNLACSVGRTWNFRLPFRNLGRWDQGSCLALVTAICIKSGIFYKKRRESRGINLQLPQKPMAQLVEQLGAAAYILHHSVPWNLFLDHQPAIKDDFCQYGQTCLWIHTNL